MTHVTCARRGGCRTQALVSKRFQTARTLQLLHRRVETGKANGEKGFVLDGFPRTVPQAEQLLAEDDIQLAVNLNLRQEVLIEKCMGRRICRKCGKGWNLADIYLAGSGEQPAIVMPPLDPPVDCRPFMEQREDDKEAVRALPPAQRFGCSGQGWQLCGTWPLRLAGVPGVPEQQPLCRASAGHQETARSLQQGRQAGRGLLPRTRQAARL